LSSFFAGKKNAPWFKRYSKLLAVLTFILIAAAGIILTVVQKNPVELIPIAGALLQTGGLWFEDEQTIRKFGLASAPFWLVYNFISQAYGAALGSVLAICSSSIAIIRYRKRRKNLMQ
ncbi:MAG: YgjV family protein, partial [Clostridia bacterium]|nr:YgjV family protein [Clostridia bacterium]